MSKTQIDALTLVGASFAAALALTLLLTPWSYLGSVVGLILLFVLLAYDQEGQRSAFQSVAYSAVIGLCFTVAFASVFQLMGGRVENVFADPRLPHEWLPLTFLIATLILLAIDRSRMATRVNEPLSAPRLVRRNASVFPSEPMVAPRPEPGVNYSAPQPVHVAESFPVTERVRAPEPVRVPEPVHVPETAPMAANAPIEPVPQTPPPEAAARPMPRGKETSIFVALVGEGMNVLRSVRAEHLGRDYYLITEEVPEGETWEFGQGQVVRCRKKNLSSGKGLVAYEEAPRAS